jgi:hypothetical protein
MGTFSASKWFWRVLMWRMLASLLRPVEWGVGSGQLGERIFEKEGGKREGRTVGVQVSVNRVSVVFIERLFSYEGLWRHSGMRYGGDLEMNINIYGCNVVVVNVRLQCERRTLLVVRSFSTTVREFPSVRNDRYDCLFVTVSYVHGRLKRNLTSLP